jgi:hypothetical protein
MLTPLDVRKFTARLKKVTGQVGISTFCIWFLDWGPVTYKMEKDDNLLILQVTGQITGVPF